MIMSKPTGSLLRDLALLSLVPEQDVLQFFNTRESDLQKAKNEGFAREQWKKHKLYRQKKDKLVKFCSERKLETFGMKYELVERLALAEDGEPPTTIQWYNQTTNNNERNIKVTFVLLTVSVNLEWFGFMWNEGRTNYSSKCNCEQ